MSFDIRFIAPPEYWSDMSCMGASGVAIFGSSSEPFVAPLTYWGLLDFERHWRAAVGHFMRSGLPTCLITEIYDPEMNDLIEWWLLYPVGDRIVVQQQMTTRGDLIPPLSMEEPWWSIPARYIQDRGDDRPSEWVFPKEDLAVWMALQRT